MVLISTILLKDRIMIDWTELDKQAAREGSAILRAFRPRRSRRPQGVDRQDTKAEVMKHDILKELGGGNA